MSEPEVIDVDEFADVIATRPGAGGAVVVHRERPPVNPFDAPVATFAQQIQQRGENYAALVDWLVAHLVEGEDVIQVHVVKWDKCQDGGAPPKGRCSPVVTPWHWSDPDISKKGAEKVCGLLGLGVRFLGMEDFRQAALKGVALNDVVVDCELYGEHGTVSQGTGACSIGEIRDGSLNSCMKKAAKRAHVDAVKRCAGLSGLATELKRRMAPPDPSVVARQSAEAAMRTRAAGTAGRWETGAELTHCPIGKKHKDKPWAEIPSDYLTWMLKEVKDKPDVARAAARELERRQSSRAATAPPPEQPPEFDDEIPF
jgi:hypothetical protein